MKTLTKNECLEIKALLKSRSLASDGRKYLHDILSGKRPYPRNKRDLMATGTVQDQKSRRAKSAKHKRTNHRNYFTFVTSDIPVGATPPRCSRFLLVLHDGDRDARQQNLANKAAHIFPELRITRDKSGDPMKIAIGMIRYRGDLDRFIQRVLGRHKK